MKFGSVTVANIEGITTFPSLEAWQKRRLELLEIGWPFNTRDALVVKPDITAPPKSRRKRLREDDAAEEARIRYEAAKEKMSEAINAVHEAQRAHDSRVYSVGDRAPDGREFVRLRRTLDEARQQAEEAEHACKAAVRAFNKSLRAVATAVQRSNNR